MGNGLQDLFKDEFENFMGMFPSESPERIKKMMKEKGGSRFCLKRVYLLESER